MLILVFYIIIKVIEKEHDMNKKALVVVSFGTTYKIAQIAIEQIEKRLATTFGEYDFYRAFTSKMVIKKLAHTEGIYVDTPLELLEKLHHEGYEEILCQSLHVINGIEYEYMLADLEKYKDKFKAIKVGNPLLTHEEDYTDCVKILGKNLPKSQADEAIILMGHGSQHYSNSAYSQLEDTFHYLDYETIYVGTVEGFPPLHAVLKKISKQPIRKIYLSPFMIVAGDHARNDLAGDEEDSWKSVLEKSGYEIEIIMKGLGEYTQIAELFVSHALKAYTL